MENRVVVSSNYMPGDKDKWLARELRHVNLGDKRLVKRLVNMSTLIEGKASGSINQSCGSWKEAKGAYRLLSNKKLNTQEIYTREKTTGLAPWMVNPPEKECNNK